MAEIRNAKLREESTIKRTIVNGVATDEVVSEKLIMSVDFEYRKTNGKFESTEDEAHYNKYAEFLELDQD